MDLEASSPKALRTVYEQATTIVWAGGYGSNMVPVRHPDGTQYNFAMRGTKVKVDGSSQLLRLVKPKGNGKPAEKPLERLFGMGVGFGHQDDVIDGIGTFVSYRAPSVLAHITNGCFDKVVCGTVELRAFSFLYKQSCVFDWGIWSICWLVCVVDGYMGALDACSKLL